MGNRSKLEPTLAALVDPAIPQRAPAGEVLNVLVKFTGAAKDLEASGFEPWTVLTHPTDGYSIASGPIPWRRLEELEAIPHVRFIEATRSPPNELNHSIPEIHADVLHNANPAHLGTGVVIGIVDSGVDFTHRSFRNPDGTTRILGIWDQTAATTNPPSGPVLFGGSGVEYLQGDIDATLQLIEHNTPRPAGTKKVTMTDDDGHGSHVAGIAAGNGHPAGNCRGDGVYTGVAPAANLLVVKHAGAQEIGEDTGLVNALAWIWNHPAARNHGVVVNMSFGDSRGPHDGTSLVEAAIEIEVLTHPGHVAVKSAGNIGMWARHAAATVPANGHLDLAFTIDGRDPRKLRHMELWYGKNDRLAVTVLGVTPAQGARPSSPVVAPGEGPRAWTVNPAAAAAQQTVTVTSRLTDQRNSDNVIVVEVLSPAGLASAAGGWALHLENQFDQPVAFHAWFDGEDQFGANFDAPFASRDATITEPGTSKGVITVGAYAQHGFLFWDWSGDLTEFSSYGPTRDGRPKPDIAAPGLQVTSVKAGAGDSCCCDCCHSFYTDTTNDKDHTPFQGTSMAAPHVTGVIALMLEQHPTMSAADVRAQLITTARLPDGVARAALPDNHWGGGKVDANGAVTTPLPTPAPAVGPTPAAAVTEPAPPAVSMPSGPVALARMADAALQLPEVQYWAALVSRHFSEVRGLINSNRWVATCWHRMDGPALVRGLQTMVADPAAARPVVDQWRPRAGRFLDMLERFGSPALRAAAAAHRADVLSVDPGELAEQARTLALAQAA
jgi:subtilisin family serine protease